MSQIRTFIAVDISNEIRAFANRTIKKLQGGSADYNWVDKDNLHITLNFLGDVDETQVPAVCKLVQDTVTDYGTFELSVQGLGCFPNSDKPRVIWLGVDDGIDELTAIHGRLSDALEAMRFPRDHKDYRPHITLGRLRRGGRWNHDISSFVERNSQLGAGKMIVDKVTVYSSYLERSGPTYTPMAKVELF